MTDSDESHAGAKVSKCHHQLCGGHVSLEGETSQLSIGRWRAIPAACCHSRTGLALCREIGEGEEVMTNRGYPVANAYLLKDRVKEKIPDFRRSCFSRT